ncbi:aminotransferase class I/II-fold pyridoxal phosphate-dependent enzyme [Blautia sp. HCP3S3_H10_1]|uniref:aminotransferase class I/II-fold pyridoxal phosphate-dependent enzyme n=1 Tax=unclassified Blautia TaxID=2648079 RepID=UPI003F93BEBB|nr:aminotransferase class I/II-fold pyridoxal phosphate-dependent enzyme [Clostridia bacterium]
MERLYKELENYGKSDFYPFHMPGHKRNQACMEGDFPIDRDITEIDGFDDLHHSEGILLEAQNALSRMYGTRKSFFSVNGSTAGLLTAISAAVKKGGQILVARNCHKAVYHAIYLRELIPTYIYPHSDNDLGINGAISVSRVERCLEENPEIEAVLITSPTYDGVVSDVQKIAETAHRHGVPLIVDEAHGAHFRFSEYFPVSAVDLGADVVIQSFHKTLPAMTQTAVLHLCSDRVSESLIHRFFGIYETSSPSYILMSSLDACVAKLEKDSHKMFAEFTDNLEAARETLGKCKYIRLIPTEENLKEAQEKREIFDYDRSKLLLSTKNSTLNGPKLSGILRKRYHIEVEMTTENYVLALAAVGDTKEGFQRLCKAVEEIDRLEAAKMESKSSSYKNSSYKSSSMKQMMSIAQAMDAPSQLCILEESVGKISAEFVYLYPPGIPIIVPGEQITGLFIRNVRRYMEQGLNLHGLCGENDEKINVVREQALEPV